MAPFIIDGESQGSFMSSKALDHYESAVNAVRRQKFPQAIKFFLKSLAKDPDYIEARRGLRAVALKEFNGKALPALASCLGDLFTIAIAKTKKRHEDGLSACDRVLSKVPNHKWSLSQGLSFAQELELLKAQEFFHTVLAESQPENADLVIDAADFLSDLGGDAFEKAVQLMTNLTSAFPNDSDLNSERNRIEAKKVVKKLENAEDQTDALKDKDAAKKLEEESQQIKTADDLLRAIERAQEREQAEPESARAKEVLADLLFRKGDLLEAIDMFKASIELDPNNQSIQARLGDTRFKLINEQIKTMEARRTQLSGAELEDLEERLVEKKKELRDTRFNEYARRLNVNPNDLKTRFELGSLYFKAKAFDKAIQQFQRSVQDARLAFRSSEYLGHCFKHKKLYDMAIREFENAAKKSGSNASDRLNVLYETANCYISSNNKAKALDVYKHILEKDFGFKDVASKVEALQN